MSKSIVPIDFIRPKSMVPFYFINAAGHELPDDDEPVPANAATNAPTNAATNATPAKPESANATTAIDLDELDELDAEKGDQIVNGYKTDRVIHVKNKQDYDVADQVPEGERVITVPNKTPSAFLKNKFNVKILQRACQEIYEHHDNMRFFIDNMSAYILPSVVKDEPPPKVDGKVDITDRLTIRDTKHKQVRKQIKNLQQHFMNAASDLYKLNSDLITKKLSKKVKYFNYWKTRPDEYRKIEEALKSEQMVDGLGANHFNELSLSSAKESVEQRSRTHTFSDFDALMAVQKDLAISSLHEVIKLYYTDLEKLKDRVDYDKLDPEYIAEIEMELAKVDAKFQKHIIKLSAIYNNEVSIMDIIFESQFMILYVLKLINFAFFALSLYLAEKLFSEMYMKRVYGGGGSPPDILVYLGLTIALNTAFLVFMLTILLLIMYIFKDPTNTFVIDFQLIVKFLIDYGITVAITGLVGILVGSTIEKKKYFRYKTEGLRGVRAYHELMLGLGSMVAIVPYFHVI
jgi:hypothetical protein